MAWEGSDRRSRLPADWPARVKACKDAAGGRCQRILPSGARCPRDGAEADHAGERDDHDHLEWLCPTHHRMKTQTEANAGKARKGSWKREPERHPGGLAP